MVHFRITRMFQIWSTNFSFVCFFRNIQITLVHQNEVFNSTVIDLHIWHNTLKTHSIHHTVVNVLLSVAGTWNKLMNSCYGNTIAKFLHFILTFRDSETFSNVIRKKYLLTLSYLCALYHIAVAIKICYGEVMCAL